MTVWPGDQIGGFEVERMVAYRGKENCTYGGCTRRGDDTTCFGWHCSLCDEPCSSFGHNCPRSAEADALGKSQRPEEA